MSKSTNKTLGIMRKVREQSNVWVYKYMVLSPFILDIVCGSSPSPPRSKIRIREGTKTRAKEGQSYKWLDPRMLWALKVVTGSECAEIKA